MKRGVHVGLSGMLGLALLALSCVNTELGGRDDSLALEDAQLVKNDIPVPLGFKYYPAKSVLKKTPAMRYLLLRYKGSADLEDAVRYYRDYGMKKEGWKFSEQSSLGGVVLLFFTKGKEKSIIRLSKGVFHVHVEIEVYAYGE